MDLKRYKPELRLHNHERRSNGVKRLRNDSLLKSAYKRDAPRNVLILDNGSYSMKIGYSRKSEPEFLPNHIMKAKSERKRLFIADQIDDCRDLSGLFYVMPYEKGYLNKFDVQKTIWDYTFNKYPIEDSLIVTQPLNNFKIVQEFMDEIFFEEYDVKSLFRANAADLSYYQYSQKIGKENQCSIVVDSGYNCTNVIPYINGKKFSNGIVRMDVGGKLLTNYLKDILSYRQLHVMEETYVINQLKEDLCYMSLDFKKDMQRSRSTNEIVRTYILPDFHNIRRGYVRDYTKVDELAENCQILKLNNERICIPEVLIRPSIINGVEQAGLSECVCESIRKCPKEYRNALAQNIVLTGGNVHFRGFKERLEREIRILLPHVYSLNVYEPPNPSTYAWEGGKSLSMDAKFRTKCVSKQQYEEYGSDYIYRRFNEFSDIEIVEKKTESKKRFSYLDYWKTKGVDILGKKDLTGESDFEIVLEGADIEKYDQKHVTVDFEFEDKVEVNPAPKYLERELREDSTPQSMDQFRFKRRKLQPSNCKEEPVVECFYEEEVSHTDVLKEPPKVTPINGGAKVYKHYVKTNTKIDNKPQVKTKLFTIGNPLAINGNSFLVPSTSTSRPMTINHSQFVNVVPQKIYSKGVTFQIIPINASVLTGGNIYFAQRQ